MKIRAEYGKKESVGEFNMSEVKASIETEFPQEGTDLGKIQEALRKLWGKLRSEVHHQIEIDKSGQQLLD